MASSKKGKEVKEPQKDKKEKKKRQRKAPVEIDARADIAIQTALGAMTAAMLSEGAKVVTARTRVGYSLRATTPDALRHIFNVRIKSVQPKAVRAGKAGPVRLSKVKEEAE